MKRITLWRRDSTKKHRAAIRLLKIFIIVAIGLVLWGIPLHHAPAKVVVDLEGRARVYTRWVYGTSDSALFLPDRVPIFTRDRSGAELPGYRVQVPEQTRGLTEWRSPTRLRRVLGGIYRLEWSDTLLMDGHYESDAGGLSPILKDDVGVDYSLLLSRGKSR